MSTNSVLHRFTRNNLTGRYVLRAAHAGALRLRALKAGERSRQPRRRTKRLNILEIGRRVELHGFGHETLASPVQGKPAPSSSNGPAARSKRANCCYTTPITWKTRSTCTTGSSQPICNPSSAFNDCCAQQTMPRCYRSIHHTR